jgi:3',5'-cyclic-AMP phosphodiesterase
MNRRRFSVFLIACLALVRVTAAVEKHVPSQPVLTFAQITDAHLRSEFDAPNRFRAALRHLRQNHPEVAFVLNTGDAVDGIKNHNDAVVKWGFWKTGIESELKGVPVYSVLGNHDIEGPAGDPLCGKDAVCRTLGMPRRYYSFDRADWHFIMLDGNGFGADREQMAWLEKELNVTNHVTVVSHQPIFSVGAMVHSPGDFIGNWKGLIALFVKHPNVKLCLGGHVHLFDKAWYNGVTYACGGAMSGYWWERQKSSDGKSGYHETRPGYGIVKLYADGSSEYEYVKFED